MKKSILLLCMVLLSVNLFSNSFTINEGWLFQLKSDGAAPEVVSFPHTWNNVDAADEVAGYFRGVGLYSKDIYLGEEARGKRVMIYFEGANQETSLTVNGSFAGTHKGGYTRFAFDITPYVEVGKANKLVIQVDNSHNPQIPPLSADFTFFGGIYRDVYLMIREPVHLSVLDHASGGVYVSTPKVSREQASVEVRTLVNNYESSRKNLLLRQTVYDPLGKTVADSKKITVNAADLNREFRTMLTVKAPMLWSTTLPNLYRLHTEVVDAKSGEVLDEKYTTFGLRWFEFDPEKGFFLNGESLKLVGTNRHQCFLGKGNALADEFHIRDIQLLKDMGGNFLRVAHYPQDPLILEMCDKLGIVASVEIPIVNAITETEEYLENCLYMAEEMVKQNFNHPSLVMWAYMNEVMLRPPHRDREKHQAYCKEVNRQAKAIEQLIRNLDPLRYTMQAFHGSLNSYNERGADIVRVPMIVGWNLYSGWYGGTFDGFEAFLDEFHTAYPDVPLLVTEYGADVDDRLHSFDSERFDFTVEYGDRYHEHYLKAILERDFVAGVNIWNLNDFHSESRTDAVPRINSKGITGLDRRLKNTYTLYQAHFNPTPMVRIGTKTWTKRGGVANENGVCIQPVKVYSNQPQVAVYHNGRLLKNVTILSGVTTVQVPFTDGINRIEVTAPQNRLTDVLEVDFDLIPANLKSDDFRAINVMLGGKRYFEDRDANLIWIPEQEYSAGSWGYIGGKPFNPGARPSADIDVVGTHQDPLYQSQRVDIEVFKLDVKDGRYAVYLYMADLTPPANRQALAYNLGNDAEYEATGSKIFDVTVNGTTLLSRYDIVAEGGSKTAVVKKILVDTKQDSGIEVRFTPISGSTILNAIRVVRLD